MFFRSNGALAAAAVLAATTLTAATPAFAAKKEKPAAPAGPVITEAVRTGLLSADMSIEANDVTTAKSLIETASAAAVSDYDRYWVERTRLKLANKVKEPQPIAAALDALMANPATPPAEMSEYSYSRGIAALNLKQPDQGLQYLRRARQLGLNDPAVSLRIGSTLMEKGDLAGGAAEISSAIDQAKAAGQKPPADWYLFVIGNYQAAKQDNATWPWWRKLVEAYPTPEYWRTALENFRAVGLRGVPANQADAAKLDLYRLMAVTGSLSNLDDYLLYSDITSQMGLRYELVSVIEAGRSAGKIPTTEPETTKALAAAKRTIAAEASVEANEADARKAKDGKLATFAGNTYLATGNTAKAIEMYMLAREKGGVDAQINALNIGTAQAKAGDGAAARATLAALDGTPLADLAGFWTLYLTTKGR